ncbi:hypothetical protein Q75_17335 [Bacillus coahuilensis p1.1.43]|uniref:Rubrerythrin diiron-binding domain-containing protein n=1 Tax=Bacillus coahuilensis p1.1.43 TaxID=1150625 RepID=A0A147K3T2_9BACI|nr:ferritin family protein [Bacillus coahuilensis]KUP03902.1 hypothetical protein Q75_17335 [Bacillus coahuilensis p1.1.43]
MDYNISNVRKKSKHQLVERLEIAINGEFSAIDCYSKLIRKAPTQHDKKVLREIIEDEKRHLEEFKTIYYGVTGRWPKPKIIESCPKNYVDAIEAAFQDEQMTVDSYLDLSSNLYNKESNLVKRAAMDEQNHAVWFLYLLNQSKYMNETRQNEALYGAKGALQDQDLTLPKMLTYAIQDEYVAQARYRAIINTFGSIRPFTTIQQAELRHIMLLTPLFSAYQIPIPEDYSSQFVTPPTSLKSAFQQGVEGEIENIAMYDKFLSLPIPEDVQRVFTLVRNASVNHLQAFRRGLQR